MAKEEIVNVIEGEDEQQQDVEQNDEQEVIEDGAQDAVDTGEDTAQDGEQDAEETADTPTDTQQKPSRRENLRIQKLVARLRAAEATPAAPDRTDGLDYRKAIDADDDVYKELEADRKKHGDSQYQAGLDQARSIQFHTRLELDAPRVASKYPQFNPESPEFNAGVASAINEWYLASAGYDAKTDKVKNSDVRYFDFVEGIMELSEELASRKNVASTKNIAKQAAQTALRPDGSTAKRLNLNQAPEKMSDEELEAAIAMAIPSKR